MWLLAFVLGSFFDITRSLKLPFPARTSHTNLFDMKSFLTAEVSTCQSTNFDSNNVQNKDVWIVGSGTLGNFLLAELKQVPGISVVGETRSLSRQEAIRNNGAEHRLREMRSKNDIGSARNVIICLPPSSSTDYIGEIHDAVRLWAGKVKGGNLIYTSSIGVYGDSSGLTVNEESPVDPHSTSSAR